jgi:hypothetical protein
LQFQRVHTADELLVHLLDQGGITRETARIQIAHLIDQGLQLSPRLGTILHYGTNLVEKIQALVNLPLGVCRVGTLLRGDGPALDSSIAGVIATKSVMIATDRAASRVSYLTSEAVAYPTRLGSAELATLTGLTVLSISGELAGLELLAAGLAGTAWLTLSRLRVGASTECCKLVAQTG